MIAVEPFGSAPSGEEVRSYTLYADSIRVRVTDFGATVLGIDVPDANGTMADVVLGFDSFKGYLDNPACYGCTIGPSANRVADGRVAIDGDIWQLEQNEGTTNLHSSLAHGLHKRIWTAEVDEATTTVRMTCSLANGELGLPGNRRFTATFTLTERGTLRIAYRCESDARTFVNMTNHTYFNLGGHSAGNVLDHMLTIPASGYLPINARSLPLGAVAPVAGTPFDFRTPRAIGPGLASGHEQIEAAHGYDHCLCIDGYWPCGRLRPALHAEDPGSGRTLDISITTPGLQLYTGNWLGDANAKGGTSYAAHAGFAAEPEHYPDTPNNPTYPQSFCGPGHPYESVIEYRFSTTRQGEERKAAR